MYFRVSSLFILLLLSIFLVSCSREQPAVVFQTDFGTTDGAVSAMKGVAYGVGQDLALHDITHDIPSYNIWEAAYRLQQVAEYWPKGTVFVSVVDPGVGTERKSIVMKSNTGHFFVSPDNGTLTLVAEQLGIAGVRQIDEAVNRRAGSNRSYTFHGRDVYAFTAARLAAGKITFEEVGKDLGKEIVKIGYQRAELKADTIYGTIPVLDAQYGNVWTNVKDSLFKLLNLKIGDSVGYRITYQDSIVFSSATSIVNTFGDVVEGSSLAYFNSLMNFSLAINQGNFAASHQVESGPEWRIIIYRN